MSKDRKRKKEGEPEIPDSMKEEVFIHQTLQKFGATPEEALAFAKVYGNMIEALAKDIKADLKKELEGIKKTMDERLSTQKSLIITIGGAVILLLGVIALAQTGVLPQ